MIEDFEFWNALAIYLTGNISHDDLTHMEHILNDDNTETQLRDASVLLGISQPKIQESFDKLDKKLHQ